MRGTLEGLVVAGLLAALVVGAERAATVRPPGGAHPPIDVRRRDPAAAAELARGLFEQGRDAEAKRAGAPGPATGEAWSLVYRAAAAEVDDRASDALRLYEQALDRSPELRAAKLGYARTVLASGAHRARELDRYLDAWLAADPFDAALLVARARRGDDALARAAEAWPADAAIALGAAARHPDEARAVLARAMAANQSDPELALTYATLRDQSGAVRAAALRQALEAVRTPRHARIALAIAGWFDERRSERDVLAALDAAVAADPGSPRLLLERATWLLAHGRPVDGLAAARDDLVWQAGGDGVADPDDRARPIDARAWLALAAGAGGQGAALAIADGATLEMMRSARGLPGAGDAALERLASGLARTPGWDRAARDVAVLAAQAGWPAARLVPWQARRARLHAGPAAAAAALTGAIDGAVRALAGDQEPAAYAHARLGLPSMLALSRSRLAAPDPGEALRALDAVMDVDQLIALLAQARPREPRWRAALTVGQNLYGPRGLQAAAVASKEVGADLAGLDELARLFDGLGERARSISTRRRALLHGPTAQRKADLGALLYRDGARVEGTRLMVEAAAAGVFDPTLSNAVRKLVEAGELETAEAAAHALAREYRYTDAHLTVAWICTLRQAPERARAALAQALAGTSGAERGRVLDYARSLGLAMR